MEKDFLYSDRLPTLDEIKELFKKNDWTTMDDPHKRTAEEWAEISYVAEIMDKKFEELVRKRGRISSAEYYSKDNPLIVLQKNTEDLVASAVVRLQLTVLFQNGLPIWKNAS